ncbi:E3 ubiquitin-protein ligase siah-1-like isoform X2 [Euwallacea fornicatus]|uniref:E3 ubiquitin-protein ligase siah-1-like isoform X2 n=1 Tax=Euwallacea fornicatus TaxID=995702 RepID=UPI0033901008
MDDNIINQSLDDIFTCPVCFEYMDQAIFMCLNGHSLCQKCSTVLSKCPICNCKLARSYANKTLLEATKTFMEWKHQLAYEQVRSKFHSRERQGRLSSLNKNLGNSGERFRELFKCPKCKTCMKSKIFACVKGHDICQECFMQYSMCPICFSISKPIRNIGLETAIRKLFEKRECDENQVAQVTNPATAHSSGSSKIAPKIRSTPISCPLLGSSGCCFSTKKSSELRTHITQWHKSSILTARRKEMSHNSNLLTASISWEQCKFSNVFIVRYEPHLTLFVIYVYQFNGKYIVNVHTVSEIDVVYDFSCGASRVKPTKRFQGKSKIKEGIIVENGVESRGGKKFLQIFFRQTKA